MRKIILGLLLLTIIGLIPAMMVVLISKSTSLFVITAILAIVWVAKEICL